MSSKCTACNGRGWLALDMMASSFVACLQCNTHEVIVSPDGYEGVRRKDERITEAN